MFIIQIWNFVGMLSILEFHHKPLGAKNNPEFLCSRGKAIKYTSFVTNLPEAYSQKLVLLLIFWQLIYFPAMSTFTCDILVGAN